MNSENSKLTQDDMVLQHLQDFGTITTWEAIKEYGITRLSAKIYNLKKKGYSITATVKTAKNRYGIPTHFNEYMLLKDTK